MALTMMNGKQEEYIPKNMLLDFLKIASTCCLPFERFGIGFAMKEISEWEPANVAPAVHGTWIDHQIGNWIYAKCSECGTVHDVKSHFCPHCGAKMDLGVITEGGEKE